MGVVRGAKRAGPIAGSDPRPCLCDGVRALETRSAGLANRHPARLMIKTKRFRRQPSSALKTAYQTQPPAANEGSSHQPGPSVTFGMLAFLNFPTTNAVIARTFESTLLERHLQDSRGAVSLA